MIPIILALACLVGAAPRDAKEKPPTIYQIPLPPKPDFSTVDWLVGEWTGKTTDQKTQGEIHLSVSYELDKQVMLLRGKASFQATKTSSADERIMAGRPHLGPGSRRLFAAHVFQHGFHHAISRDRRWAGNPHQSRGRRPASAGMALSHRHQAHQPSGVCRDSSGRTPEQKLF